MRIEDVIGRDAKPTPWSEGDNIPWNEPGFSARMLREHLSQAHDLASRRLETVARQVDWIDREVLGAGPARVLDLGCGPGLYLQRLAERGHLCRGIDFSPASIDHARREAAVAGYAIDYIEADIRSANFGATAEVDAVLMLFGEFNVFAPEAARTILEKAAEVLRPGGRLLLEPATAAAVRRMGSEPPGWWSAREGLFGDDPHLMLVEASWDGAQQAATRRYYRIDAASGEVTRWASSQQAYSEDAYRALLAACGFGAVRVYPGLAMEAAGDFCAILAQKA